MITMIRAALATAILFSVACNGVHAPFDQEELNSRTTRFDIRGHSPTADFIATAQYRRWSDNTWQPLGTGGNSRANANRATLLDGEGYLWRVGNVQVPTNGWQTSGTRVRAELRVFGNNPYSMHSVPVNEFTSCVMPAVGVSSGVINLMSNIQDCTATTSTFVVYAP